MRHDRSLSSLPSRGSRGSLLPILGLLAGGAVAVTLVGGVVLAIAVASRGVPWGPPVALTVIKRLTEEQARNAATIVLLTRQFGLPASVAGALLANAWAESMFDAEAAGDVDSYGNAHSYGLFQLHDGPQALGYGMSPSQRKNPVVNTTTILRAVLSSQGAAVRSAAASGASIADLAALVSRDIEQPSDEIGAMIARRTYALSLFGEPATYAGSRINYAA